MTAGAGTAGEGDIRAGVDRDAVILVVDLRAGNGNRGAVADIETISVVATIGVSIGAIDCHISDSQVFAAVDLSRRTMLVFQRSGDFAEDAPIRRSDQDPSTPYGERDNWAFS